MPAHPLALFVVQHSVTLIAAGGVYQNQNLGDVINEVLELLEVTHHFFCEDGDSDPGETIQ